MVNINYREYRKEDESGAEALVAEAWDYSVYGYGPSIRHSQALRELLHCLSNSNYAEVALADGKVAGLLIGRFEGEPLRGDYKDLRRRANKIIFENLFNPVGRLLHDYMTLYRDSDGKLLQESGKEYDAEIVLLVVAKKYKGFGIGKGLIMRFEDHLIKRGAQRLYLFTDSTCDCGFYYAQGFNKIGETSGEAALRKNEVIDFYILERSMDG